MFDYLSMYNLTLYNAKYVSSSLYAPLKATFLLYIGIFKMNFNGFLIVPCSTPLFHEYQKDPTESRQTQPAWQRLEYAGGQ